MVWDGGGVLAADMTLAEAMRRWDSPGLGDAPFTGESAPPAVMRGVPRTMVTRAADRAKVWA